MAWGKAAVSAGGRRRGIACLAALALAGAAPATAQDADAQGRSAQPSQAQASTTQSFDIPAQPLGTALVRFSEATGIQLFLDSSVARGVQSPGVRGTMSRQDALNQLLAGSGLVYRFTNANTVTVERPQARQLPPGVMQLDPVQVQGYPVPPQAMIDNLPPPYAGGQVATGGQLGLLGNRDFIDTPFNQTSYTAKKAQDQQAQTVRDVLVDDPSVRAWGRDGAVTPDNLWIRGFTVVPQNMAYGGLYGMLPSFTVMAELAERIEVLKGPSAMLTGMAPSNLNIGGTVNVVPKRAPDEALTQATANYVSAGQVGGHLDFARRFGDERRFGVRFNGVFRAGQTEVEWNSDQRAFGLLGLDFRGERVRLSADLGYQSQYIGGQMANLALANGIPVPWVPLARENQGQPWGWELRKDLFGVVRGELDLAERITAYASLGAHDNRQEAFALNRFTITGFNGNATPRISNVSNYIMSLTAEGGVRGMVDTGPIGHEFALTATTLSTQTGDGAVDGPVFATNLYNPTIIAQPSIPTPAAVKTAIQNLSSLGFADTLSAAEKRVQLTVGVRLQQVQATNYARSGVASSSYDQSAFSPSVALIVKPFWENVSFYGNYIQGLQQGIIVGPAFANAGEIFPPFKSTQYEAGMKIDWGKFTTTASLFQISQPSILTNVETNTQFLGGEQVNQGLEFNFFGEPIPGVRLLGGAMLLNAVVTKTQGGLTDGWVAPFSPGLNLNLAGEWDLPFVRGLTVMGRLVYTGEQYIDTTWPRRTLAEWTRLDFGARFAFENPGAKGKLLVARFNVDNVLDTNYWAGGGSSGNLTVGAPRTFRLSLTADF